MTVFEKSISGLSVPALWKLLAELGKPIDGWKRGRVIQEMHKRVQGK